uniref:Uncharacterized protein n=1 Tax=Anguilla anguilla TaxID=7936 RepID=A0A0E9V9R8_ANGAN
MLSTLMIIYNVCKKKIKCKLDLKQASMLTVKKLVFSPWTTGTSCQHVATR